MAKQAKSDLPPLLPLEYCRIDRAARLLGCEEQDILHWGEIGAISLMIDGGDIYKNGITTSVFDGRSEVINVARKGDTISLELQSSGQYLSRSDTYSQAHLKDEPSPLIEFEDAIIRGFWDVDSLAIYRLTRGIKHAITLGSPDSWEVFAALLSNMVLSTDMFWIMRDDLELLHQHINDGAQLPGPFSKSNQEEQITTRTLIESGALHPVAERHAANREQVLAAAIYAKTRWPDECGDTAICWATAISEHEATLFDDKKAPLSVEVTSRLLSSVLTDGKIKKNQ